MRSMSTINDLFEACNMSKDSKTYWKDTFPAKLPQKRFTKIPTKRYFTQIRKIHFVAELPSSFQTQNA